MQNSSTPRGSYRKLSYSQKLAIVNNRKRHGDITATAIETDYSPNYVSEVLSGKHYNERILNRAYNRARARIENAHLV
jgi:hypothetical protein